MLGVQLDAGLKRFRPVALGLARQTVDEVEAHIFKAGPACVFHRHLRLLEIVSAAYHFQNVVIGRLHADRQPVHALTAQELEVVKPHRVGIDLHCYLRIEPDIAYTL